MASIYARIQNRARQIIARFPTPDFYSVCSRAVDSSRLCFNSHPQITPLKTFVTPHLSDDYGHGLRHSVKVAVDAGALMLIEGEYAGYDPEYLNRRVLIVHATGLLHDIKRKHKHHARLGADHARKILRSHPSFSQDEIDDICQAIANHTAFKKILPIKTPAGEMVSNCLYDADKFRWGPDNFRDTLWEMVSFSNPPLSEFLRQYPKGMESLMMIKETFRTRTGKKFGPRFIDLGLAMGKEIYEMIRAEFTN